MRRLHIVSNLADVKMKHTPGLSSRGARPFGLYPESEQEGGELDVGDEAEAGEVTW